MIGCSVHASSSHSVEFVETQTEWNGKWNKSVMYYNVIGTCRTMSKKQIKKAFNYAMTTWDLEIPIKFKPSQWFHFTPPDITIEFKDRTNDQTFKDKPSVLAYAYFPEQGHLSGKIVFNNDYIWDYLGKGIKASEALKKGWIVGTSNPENTIKTYSIIAVLIHELGHSLGLRHDITGNSDGVDVMDAYYSGENRLELSERDIYRIVSKYGNRIYSRWSHYARLKKAVARGKRRL